MAANNADAHRNAQNITFLAPLTIAGAISATTTTPVVRLSGVKYLAVEAVFLYGSGGTSVDAYVQTSFDGGLSWMDIMEFNFLLAAATKMSAVSAYQAATVVTVPTDGSLASNTMVQGFLGNQFRLKYKSAGTYAGATSLAVYGVAKG